jgi:hypothetical protein
MTTGPCNKSEQRAGSSRRRRIAAVARDLVVLQTYLK